MRCRKTITGFIAVILSLFLCLNVSARLTKEDIQNLRQKLKARNATFTVGLNSATEYDLSELCGLVPPENWWIDAPFRDISARRLAAPASWNWCDQGDCTLVKNQGSCGSCWAFATVGPLECNILIKDGVEVDLSEQYLVSCNADGWNCSGGWWAHDYHEWKYNDPEIEAGAVPEIEFPYVASDAPCGGPYSHPWKIADWGYIGDSASIPSVDAIKQAIMDYGPVAVAIHVGTAFHAYTGGIFNINEPGTVNHGVVLVGWDDSQGTNGVWILRNSWGPGWGENGYMRIEYGTSQVGYAANYVVYSGTVLIPDLVVLSVETDPAQPEPGEQVSVQVTVKNQGSTDAYQFPVDWYADLSSSPATGLMGDARDIVSSLAPGEIYAMNTTYTYADSGNYNMYAQVDSDEEVEESNETNNVLGPVHILVGACECDLNQDSKCDMQDWLLFGADWGKTDCGTHGVDCACDLNCDGKCDMEDWVIFGEDWGRTDCPAPN
ncbi:MAG: hypothetical protein DRG83_04005 [Deltaproteobacteria bacterium]|nr:MAG: hypothetical protein DRG83_04005 [Deltaproteobacteria bacterium]